MSRLIPELGYSWRNLSKSPGFTAVAVLSLALGLSVNCAIFSIVNAVLLRPLPFVEPDRLVKLWEEFSQQDPGRRFELSEVEFVDLREQATVFDAVAGYYVDLRNLTGTEVPEQIQVARVSPNLFSLLGVPAALGRTFRPEEERPGSRVVLLSDGAWRQRFGADRGALGKTLLLNGESFSIVGVMPQGFRFPLDPETKNVQLWLPETIDRANLPARRWGRFGRYLQVVARLKPGVSFEQARAQMNSLALGFQQNYPDSYKPDSGWGIGMASMLDSEVGEVRPGLLALMGAGSLVLLITCVNLGNLLLTRTHKRRREFAVRTAVGASQGRISRQLFFESLLMAIAGGALGLLIALWGVRVLIALMPPDIPRIDTVGLNAQVAVFALLISTLAAAITALAPTLQMRGLSSFEELRQGGGQTTSLRGNLFRRLLVAAEVAIALVVLIGAGLLLKNFLHLQEIDPGFDAHDLLTLKISLSETKYDQPAKITSFYQDLLQRVQSIPGVEAAGVVSHLPLAETNSSWGISAEGRLLAADEMPHEVDFRSVSPQYFQAMGISVLKGRTFSGQDHAMAPEVVIVDDRLAERFWPDEDPIGKRLKRGRPEDPERPWQTVVGVVHHVKHQGVADETEREQIYYPLAQFPWASMSLVLRTNMAHPLSLADAVRRKVLEIDSDQPIASVQTMEDRLSESLAKPRFSMLLLTIFGLFTLLLVSGGTYAVISNFTVERTREIGVRMALGARRSDVLFMVLGQNFFLAVAGIVLGLLAAFWSTRLLASQLHGVSPNDPWTFAAAALLLAAVVLLATFVPARRASGVSPLVALRQE